MVIDVKIWNHHVGSLVWDKTRGLGIFEYNQEFKNSGLNIAPLLMPLHDSNNIFEFTDISRATFNGLPPMVADSLPDDFGNIIMNTWLSSKGLSISNISPVQRLAYMGKRGMGALEYEPSLDDTSKNPEEKIIISELVTISHQVLESKNEHVYSNLDKNSLTKILQIGTSAGGARAKAILAYDHVNKIFKAGDIIHGKNHSYWLLKLDGVSNKILGDPNGFGKIEYAYYKMALDSGIAMTQCDLIHEGPRSHFMTKRFDRTENGEKLHMQTLCGIAGFDFKIPYSQSYEQVFRVMRELQLPHNDVEQQFRRMVFNVVARNHDDHPKNISLLMNKQGKWSLSPAYDVCYSYNPNGFWTNKHQLFLNGKGDDFTLNDLYKVGEENHIRDRKQIVEHIIDSVSKWSNIAKEVGVEAENIKKIESVHRLFNKSEQIKSNNKKGV